MQDVRELREQGIGFNNYKITVDSNGVFLDIDPYVRVKIHRSKFKAFAEWYLEDQSPNKPLDSDAEKRRGRFNGLPPLKKELTKCQQK